MKVNITPIIRDHDYFPGWFLIRCVSEITKLQDKKQNDKIFKKNEDNLVDVILTMNGVELPFVETMLSVEEWFDKAVLKKANELIEDKLNDKMETAGEVVDDLVEQLRTILEKAKAETGDLDG